MTTGLLCNTETVDQSHSRQFKQVSNSLHPSNDVTVGKSSKPVACCVKGKCSFTSLNQFEFERPGPSVQKERRNKLKCVDECCNLTSLRITVYQKVAMASSLTYIPWHYEELLWPHHCNASLKTSVWQPPSCISIYWHIDIGSGKHFTCQHCLLLSTCRNNFFFFFFFNFYVLFFIFF